MYKKGHVKHINNLRQIKWVSISLFIVRKSVDPGAFKVPPQSHVSPPHKKSLTLNFLLIISLSFGICICGYPYLMYYFILFLFSSDIVGILLYAFISDLVLSFRFFYDSSLLIIVAVIHSFHSSLLFHCMNMPQCSFYFSLDGHYANFFPQLQTISSYCKHASDFWDILWPFLILPFKFFSIHQYLQHFMNLICCQAWNVVLISHTPEFSGSFGHLWAWVKWQSQMMLSSFPSSCQRFSDATLEWDRVDSFVGQTVAKEWKEIWGMGR